LPLLITALLNGNKRHAIHIYENARHAFHNDTGASYDPAAACDAWAKTLDFFNRRLNAQA
jgi:carboxymethylenebutenolidase